MKEIPYANLHLHSTHSDGVYSPGELVRIAKAEGYRALAITDHDTVSAYPDASRCGGLSFVKSVISAPPNDPAPYCIRPRRTSAHG